MPGAGVHVHYISSSSNTKNRPLQVARAVQTEFTATDGLVATLQEPLQSTPQASGVTSSAMDAVPGVDGNECRKMIDNLGQSFAEHSSIVTAFCLPQSFHGEDGEGHGSAEQHATPAAESPDAIAAAAVVGLLHNAH